MSKEWLGDDGLQHGYESPEPTSTKRIPSSPVCSKAGLWPYPCHGRLELQESGRMKGVFLCEEHALQATSLEGKASGG